MERSTNARHSTLSSWTRESNTLSVLSKDVSLEDAKEYWKDCQADGKVDWIFEKLLNKLKILWQKIKDGSATNLEYVRAVILVNEAEQLEEDTETLHTDIQKENKVQENTDCAPERKEDSCADLNSDCSTCSCLQLTAQAFEKFTDSSLGIGPLGYKHKRLQEPVPTGLYECNLSCKCDRTLCQNRVVQHGLQLRLQVFKTDTKGWGVRCLDDVDNGTFVCIYAGRILIRTADSSVKTTLEDSVACGNEAKEDNGSTSALMLSKRKRKPSHSDSEVTVMHLTPYSMRSLGLSVHRQSNTLSLTHLRSGGREISLEPFRRPKTKTSMLQKRRRQLIEEGACTVHNSSEEEGPTPPQSPKQKFNAGRKIHRNENSDETASGYVSEESSSSVISGGHPSEKPTCRTKSKLNKMTPHLSTSPEQTCEEDLHFLDASKEGNVGRFLNHSCCPNLFVQHVFVDTHQKSFPWVAFFTNSVVKAGTELTWDYNYVIGTAPDQEIQCLCGQQTCKHKIV
ncbi:hypothetical protein XENTR_v10006879 [Xenopus tropicalis]|uniref:Histone-lysine N-methyltransferase SETDB2 isoform X2 n=1 Tax=Xenopus tropicalis TaxID=8364 RepID=A0A8J1J0T1_XENTR|nr:histone-lysine N-methyltransferase SETDB2 isoform X2 [Xenopus tropicalis]KAE8627125.1 hypothetical protein XENTR_v10006879 [Xenopus tropicalis]KAE8627126.1 hypothetical protein XENTR_v10006879 [Xenopus tropicalis]KAE8627127.1 hypothetical protein XENTR_v10006879 [Xenopus tropicalis]KAE8627128.1 hypothetical protein XENTR_v10006879 [Xenopus tropicalis]KAE8627129.1 hypothetical protein XENTR_v10006879 [Xenopus tropicalis]